MGLAYHMLMSKWAVRPGTSDASRVRTLSNCCGNHYLVQII